MFTVKNKRNNLKKKSVAKNITSNVGIPNLYSAKIINDLIYILITQICSHEKIKIKNFGTFLLKEKKKRIGMNPKDKKKYDISARKVVIFKVASKLKLRINNNAKK